MTIKKNNKELKKNAIKEVKALIKKFGRSTIYGCLLKLILK
jgi:hypothetical protein